MLIDTYDHDRCFRGYTITDAAVRNRNKFYFVLQSQSGEEHEDVPSKQGPWTRVVSCFLDAPTNKRWGFANYSGLNLLLAGAAQRPDEKFVGVDMEGSVLAVGSGTKGFEQNIPAGPKGPRRGGVRKTRTLEGFLHVSTGYRGLARRDASNQWTSLCETLDFERDPDLTSAEYGFEDFDAFSTRDYYCVGGKGDVWHFDGKVWEQIEFPSNMYLETVCCAGDGQVYIGGADGAIWRGREDEWKLIHGGEMTLPFNDMVWFKDRLYCTSDYGFWELVGDELRDCDVPAGIKICSGNLAVADGVMLLAGLQGAAYHDGQAWKLIFNTTAF